MEVSMNNQRMPLLRPFAMLLVALLLLSSLVSCGTTGDGQGTTVQTTGKTETTAPIEEMDFSSMDLSQYISLGQYKGIKVQAKEIDYIVALRTKLFEDGAYFEQTEDPDRVIELGDVVNVDYKGFLDGVAFEGGKTLGADVTVYDTGTYVPGFATGFIGAAPGESSSFEVTFPKDYGDTTMAGKTAVFEFTVNHVYDFDPLSDVIANDLSGGQYPTAAEYEQFLRNQVVQVEIWEQVVHNATIRNYPEQQVNYYYYQNRSYYEYYASMYGMTYNDLLAYSGLTDKDLYESAKTYVLEDLVFYAIQQAESIEYTEEEYNRDVQYYINRYKSEYGYSEDYIRQNLMSAVEENMLYDKVQTAIVGWAAVTWESAVEDNASADTEAAA
jgi:trigger factor